MARLRSFALLGFILLAGCSDDSSKPVGDPRDMRKGYPMVNSHQRQVAEAAIASPATVKPYRTFVTIENYTIENTGEQNPVSNVRLDIDFPTRVENSKPVEEVIVQLPGKKDYWAIGNGQVQPIQRTFEIPSEAISNDGFKFKVQMIRKGAWFKPCMFDVTQLSQFNRSYICRTDTNWQTNKGVSEHELDKEALQVRVFTDLHPMEKGHQDQRNAIALRPR